MESPGSGSTRAKPGGRAFPEAGCLQDTSALSKKGRGGRVGAVGGGGVGWGDRLSYARIPREAASSLPPLLCAPSPPTPDGEGIPKPGCWEEWPPPLPMPAGSSPRSCALGAQGGVGTEPRAPAHWPSSNLPGDDRLRYLMRTRMRTPNKNKRINPTRPASLTAAGSQPG